ncbi:caspase, EACC1-associated type [Leptothoe sp. PORK10 BA2]|uniref:caspase, EACC1-associated type n=1 Tax=Leptothoe sp. PORK10 BA2 TaxID=3110254 RepID=UPI002B1EEEC2|nr:GUN4 domain-containing protein [Leptothoe sp. PORK10 BA2]MEA5462981.1 GUN4 domain-containing protein [Leptothoe sp. PORK10 BA2]
MGKYALLIGVGEYGKGLTTLPAAPRDVAAFAEVLRDPQMGGFDEVKPIVNPRQAEMAREIELWFQGRGPEDLVLLFFSGHGIKDERRELYFATHNTEKQRDLLVRSTAISAHFVNDCIRSCKAKYQVVILDCCFSGAFGNAVARDDGEVNLQDQLGAEGRVVLTSTSEVDYSYEEKGAELSIYTRYLVEGITSGIADEDSDGVITVEELHRYAERKVKAISPAMSPKIITLKDEGYRIQLACSPQHDPKLKYRKEAEKRAKEGRFSIPARKLLNSLRQELEISDADADVIEVEVLKPYQNYQRKLQEYDSVLRECLEAEELNSRNVQDLMDFWKHLSLNSEDVVSVERKALDGYSLAEYIEVERQQQLGEIKNQQKMQEERQHQGRESINKQLGDDDLRSENFGDGYYFKLRGLLAIKDWKAADQETANRMNELIDLRQGGFMGRAIPTREKIEEFPCLDLRNINNLWLKYSEGRFGFSVQQKIWEKCGSPTKYNTDWEKFGEAVGWKDTRGLVGLNAWYIYDNLNFDEKPYAALPGHFPAAVWCSTGAAKILSDDFGFYGLMRGGSFKFGAATISCLFSRAKICGL